jgi:hypothetical protein
MLLSFRYQYSKPKVSFDGQYEAHLLVVKKEVYVSIAKICVESFLYYNPNSTVVIHVDSKTKAASHKALKKLIAKSKVSIEQINSDSAPWQDSKLSLILSLGVPEKFFMDADLKWNGPIRQLSGITLFVNEFILTENELYQPITKTKWFSEFSNSTMKNTSFFYWGNYKPSAQDENQIEVLMERIIATTDDQANSEIYKSSTKRISEQIALSLLVEKLNSPIYFLKESDGFKDGSFVESSYFGATGASF